MKLQLEEIDLKKLEESNGKMSIILKSYWHDQDERLAFLASGVITIEFVGGIAEEFFKKILDNRL